MSDQKEREHPDEGEALYNKVAHYSWLVSSCMGAGAFVFLSVLMVRHFKVSAFNWPDALNYAIWVISPLLISVGSLWRFRASDTDIRVMRQTLIPSIDRHNRNRVLSFCAGLCIGSSGPILALFIIAFKTAMKNGSGNIALYGVFVFSVVITIWMTVLLIKAFRRAAPETFKPWPAALGVITIYLVLAYELIPH